MRRNRIAGRATRSPRRAFTVPEVILSLLLLSIAMGAVVQMLGSVAQARRAVERRQWATQELANLMEHLAAQPWDGLNSESARALTLSEEIRRKLPDPELGIDVDDRDAPRGLKRLALRLRWRNRAGTWEAPVRLTAWIARQGGLR